MSQPRVHRPTPLRITELVWLIVEFRYIHCVGLRSRVTWPITYLIELAHLCLNWSEFDRCDEQGTPRVVFSKSCNHNLNCSLRSKLSFTCMSCIHHYTSSSSRIRRVLSFSRFMTMLLEFKIYIFLGLYKKHTYAYR